jgi:hypothetical protein
MTRIERERAHRRRTLRIGGLLVLGMAVLPVVLWHTTIVAIASAFRLEARYFLMGWTPWILMALGLACFIPIAVEALRDPERRFVRRGTGAWYGWGLTLYLLGFGLATQVQQIADLWIDT